jgi:hypothetical protein
VFHDVSASARTQNTLSVKALVVHRENEHGQIWSHRAQVFDQFKTTLAWQRNVGQNEIGFTFRDCVERLFGILSLRTNGQILLAANPFGYPVPRHRMIVHNHDALPDGIWELVRGHGFHVQTTLVPVR